MAYNQQPQPSRVKLPPRNSIQKYRHQVAAQARAMGMSSNLVNHALTSPFTQVLASEDLRSAAPDEGPPSEETILKELRDHLTIAAHLELSTIPIYLYGMYSAKQRKDAQDLLSIVIEEMLHLVLAGNVYVAITPQDAPPLLLYDPSIAERYHYPSLMFDRIPELMLHLRPLDEAFIDMGKQVKLGFSCNRKVLQTCMLSD
ncbi:hypothetical protein FRC02_005821 [Tulasnella sp. 418]|nr:hypothetical protein FRC02_005821 [Tulasnella sp. 418]